MDESTPPDMRHIRQKPICCQIYNVNGLLLHDSPAHYLLFGKNYRDHAAHEYERWGELMLMTCCIDGLIFVCTNIHNFISFFLTKCFDQ